MLLLTRKVGESVTCSVDGVPLVTVKVLELWPNGQVRLGFEADRTVAILRDNAVSRRADDEKVNGNR
jgi:carbon storage regulator CsrA